MIIVPPVTTSGSPAALELAQRIAQAIEDYRNSHPGTSDGDVRDALRIAALGRRGDPTRRLIFMAAAVGLVVAMLLFFMTTEGISRGRGWSGMIAVWVAMLALGLAFAIFKARRR